MAAFIIALVFALGLTVGFVLGIRLNDYYAKKELRRYMSAADAERKRADLTKQWADATIQSIADAAADYGLQLNLDDMPVAPRPEAKEWPQVIGEK